jgi:hypothetical protein
MGRQLTFDVIDGSMASEPTARRFAEKESVVKRPRDWHRQVDVLAPGATGTDHALR